jgi:hypothetical protein
MTVDNLVPFSKSKEAFVRERSFKLLNSLWIRIFFVNYSESPKCRQGTEFTLGPLWIFLWFFFRWWKNQTILTLIVCLRVAYGHNPANFFKLQGYDHSKKKHSEMWLFYSVLIVRTEQTTSVANFHYETVVDFFHFPKLSTICIGKKARSFRIHYGSGWFLLNCSESPKCKQTFKITLGP